LKNDVLSQLPKKTRSQVYVAISASHRATLDRVLKDMQSKSRARHNSKASKKDVIAASSDHFAMMQELWKDTGTAKLPAVLDWLKDRLECEAGSFLVFAYHQNVINGICVTLDELHIQYIRIDGNTPGTTRMELVDTFQNMPNCRVAVLSLTAAGCGITLTKASSVIFAELYWNPGTLRQAEDRAHRIGQESPVDVYYLIARNSIDEAIWSTVSRKLEVLGSALNGTGESLQATAVDHQDVSAVDTFISRASDPALALGSEHIVAQLLDTILSYDDRKARNDERKRLREQAGGGAAFFGDPSSSIHPEASLAPEGPPLPSHTISHPTEALADHSRFPERPASVEHSWFIPLEDELEDREAESLPKSASSASASSAGAPRDGLARLAAFAPPPSFTMSKRRRLLED
jgi:hypothetical protein